MIVLPRFTSYTHLSFLNCPTPLCIWNILARKMAPKQLHMMRKREVKSIPWEPTTRIFRGYDLYVEGLKLAFFMVLGSKGLVYLGKYPLMTIP